MVVVAGLLLADAEHWVEPLLEWVESLGWAAAPLFILLHAAAVVLLLPGILFPLGAGFLFGTAAGTAYSVVGKLLGATISFLLARHALGGALLRGRSRKLESRYAGLNRLFRRLPEGGWRNVLLIRLVPAIPFKISNYLFGWSRFTLRAFVLGTLLGAIPFSWINAYLGSLGASVASLEPGTAPRSQIEWILFAIGAVISIAATIGIVTVAIRILKRSSAQVPASDSLRGDEPRASGESLRDR